MMRLTGRSTILREQKDTPYTVLSKSGDCAQTQDQPTDKYTLEYLYQKILDLKALDMHG